MRMGSVMVRRRGRSRSEGIGFGSEGHGEGVSEEGKMRLVRCWGSGGAAAGPRLLRQLGQ